MEAKKEVKALICVAVFVFLAGYVSAQGSAIAAGGNITNVNISIEQASVSWQGFAGTIVFVGPDAPNSTIARGGEVNGTQINITSLCSNPTSVTGFVIFSNSSTAPTGLTPGNFTVLDIFLDTNTTDTANNTFLVNSTFTISGSTITDVPTAFTYVNSGPQSSSFREGYFQDSTGNLVFAVAVDLDTTGYNSSSFDFQALLPTRNQTDTTFFLTTDLNIVCPVAFRRGGGGGGGRGYRCIWSCGNWTQCEGNVQYRDCLSTPQCIRARVKPSEERLCLEQEVPAPIDERLIIKQLNEDSPLTMVAPKEITVKVGREFNISIGLANAKPYSVEQLNLSLITPELHFEFTPLHTNPQWNALFGILPRKATDGNVRFAQQTMPFFRMAPRTQQATNIIAQTPIMLPQEVQGRIDLNAGDATFLNSPITVIVEAEPFVVLEEEGTVYVFIDNRDKKEETAHVELNFNKGRSTLYTELYTLKVPADDIGLYAYNYRNKLAFDHIIARYKNYKTEVR